MRGLCQPPPQSYLLLDMVSFLSLFTFDIRLVLFYPTLMFSKIVYFVCFSALGQMYHNCHVFILEYAHHPFFKRHRWILAFVLPHWVSSD